jgi:hypothetical protein
VPVYCESCVGPMHTLFGQNAGCPNVTSGIYSYHEALQTLKVAVTKSVTYSSLRSCEFYEIHREEVRT